MFQTKEQIKFQKKWRGDRQSTWEIVKVVIVKMIKELRRRKDKQSEKLDVFKKELESIKKNQTDEEYNNWNEKYTRRNQK